MARDSCDAGRAAGWCNHFVSMWPEPSSQLVASVGAIAELSMWLSVLQEMDRISAWSLLDPCVYTSSCAFLKERKGSLACNVYFRIVRYDILIRWNTFKEYQSKFKKLHREKCKLSRLFFFNFHCTGNLTQHVAYTLTMFSVFTKNVINMIKF